MTMTTNDKLAEALSLVVLRSELRFLGQDPRAAEVASAFRREIACNIEDAVRNLDIEGAITGVVAEARRPLIEQLVVVREETTKLGTLINEMLGSILDWERKGEGMARALKFYAEEVNYIQTGPQHDAEPPRVIDDRGRMAREALHLGSNLTQEQT